MANKDVEREIVSEVEIMIDQVKNMTEDTCKEVLQDVKMKLYHVDALADKLE